MMEFDKSVCADLKEASSREWLETNGLGGFASSTLAGMNTRRYHGLLTAATRPPVGRLLLLSKLEETLVIGDRRMDLATNAYQGAVHPRGHELLVGFRLDPFPVFTFQFQDVKIEKSVFMVQGSNTTVVEYRVLNAPRSLPLALEVRPLVAFRDYHSTTHENAALDPTVVEEPGQVSVAPYSGLPRLYLAHNAARVETRGYWYRRFFYSVEADRGLDALEDLFNPLTLTFDLSQAEPATIIASTESQRAENAGRFHRAEIARRKRIVESAPVNDPLVQQLTLAADQYLVQRGDGHTVVAGYPWFADWGRDTMISLSGLTLPAGNSDLARSILLQCAHQVDQGMLPNRFPDQGEASEFNTVDATLWFFEAVRAYLQYTGEEEFVRKELYPVLKNILDWHMRGTRYGVRMMENGLLNAGEPGVPLTWMDAKIGDWVVTPRSGKPVEIQALWFNALKIMEALASRFGDAEAVKPYRTTSSLVQWTFNRVFWNEQTGCLYDVVNGRPDGSIRPNQVFAVSLHHSMLSRERAQRVLDVVEQHLLTPYGLRTLSPEDPNYRGQYRGDQVQRDSAYHQGTVWPWLLGPFITACLKVRGNTEESRKWARNLLRPLEGHLREAGIGQISEVFDGDPPHRPGGCFAQAWSVAEVLRALCEDVGQLGRNSKEETLSAD